MSLVVLPRRDLLHLSGVEIKDDRSVAARSRLVEAAKKLPIMFGEFIFSADCIIEEGRLVEVGVH